MVQNAEWCIKYAIFCVKTFGKAEYIFYLFAHKKRNINDNFNALPSFLNKLQIIVKSVIPYPITSHSLGYTYTADSR